MAGTQSSFSIDYDSQAVTDVLDQLIANVSDTQPAMKEIAEYLHERTRYHFNNQQDPDGNPWAPLAASTLKAKQRKGVPINKILHGQSLNLRDEMVSFWSNGEAGVGTDTITDAYAATQQFGADERNIEARPFLGLSADDETEVIEILNQFLTDGV